MIQWCDTPRPSESRPSHTACTDSACCASAIGCLGCTGTTAVPISMRLVSTPMMAAAVSASKSSGTCGIQTEASPASSAQRASDRSRSALVAYRPRSGPTMAPMRIDLPPGENALLRYCNVSSDGDGEPSHMTSTDSELYYDPYDFEIDADPYPLWRRLRDERPLYYNERYDFWALSRFEDVEKALVDWHTYSSAKGTLLELIKSDFEIPPGSIIFEDPPNHDLHRGLLSRVFTPKKMAAIEPKIREFCARSLDPLVGSGGFDFVADLGAQMPMRTIGMLLGIPEQDQVALRDRGNEGLRLADGEMPELDMSRADEMSSAFAEYIDWRADHPSDDVMTELLQREYEDLDGTKKHLTRQEILNFIGLLASAGNETTTRLIAWTGKVLAE